MNRANSAPGKPRPFIVREIDARMLRKHPELSKGARMLWLTLRGMANGKTGELRFREHWFSGKEIDRRAEISDRTRQQHMKDLVRAGFVRMERERTEGMLTDRLTGHRRWRKGVLGEVHYTVFKSPRQDRVSCVAQSTKPYKQRSSTTRNFSRPLESCNTPNKTEDLSTKSAHKQRVSTTRNFYQRGKTSATKTHTPPEGGACVSRVGGMEGVSLESSSVSGKAPEEKSEEKPDDDSSDPSDRIEELKRKAKSTLIAEGHEADYVETAIDSIDQRSFDSGTAPGTPNYYLASFKTLQHSSVENAAVWDQVKQRRARRAKAGIPLDATNLQLSPEQERDRRSFNELHKPSKATTGAG